MDTDFKLGTELTEEDVSGDRHISARRTSAAGSSGLNLNAATNGGWGLVVGALALWAIWWLFPGNQRQPQHTPPPALSEAPAALQPETRRPNNVTVEMGANGIVIKGAQTAASAPSSGAGKTTHKAAPAASPLARSRAASAAADSQPDQ
jgi:hypothetical protein